MGLKKETPRCRFCGSAQIYFRVKTEDFQCQKCGRAFTSLKDSGSNGEAGPSS